MADMTIAPEPDRSPNRRFLYPKGTASMFAALAVAPTAAPDSGLFAAVILAAGVTALVALAMMLFSLRRSSRLTVVRGAATLFLGLGVVAVATLGIVAVSPGSAQATPDD